MTHETAPASAPVKAAAPALAPTEADLARLLASLPVETGAPPALAAQAVIRPVGAEDVPVAGRADFVERLSDWLGWTGAIELSAALTAAVPATGPAVADSHAGLAAALARLQLRLQADIAAWPPEPLGSAADCGPWRRHMLGLQRALQDETDALRRRLQQALLAAAPVAPGLARLAALDAVLQRNLGPQQRALLGWVPLRLQAHYEHLHRLHGDEDAAALGRRFQPALEAALRAELAQRLLPLKGLLAALRAACGPGTAASPPPPHPLQPRASATRPGRARV